jgi:hypothetical protein
VKGLVEAHGSRVVVSADVQVRPGRHLAYAASQLAAEINRVDLASGSPAPWKGATAVPLG